MAGSAPHIPGCRDLSLIGERVARSLFSAYSDAVGRPVTVTVFPPLAEGRTRAGFDEAAATAQRLGAHPSVLSIHEWGHAPDGRPWLVTDPQPAESVDTLVTLDGPLDVERALQVGVLLAGALETAHRAGIVHGDLQPDRIVFGPHGEPLMVETGLAPYAVFPGLGALNNPVRYHAPPEVLERTTVTPATDVYSLATTVYALLAGRAPQQKPAEVTDSNASLLLRILQMPVPPIDRPDLPSGLLDALASPLSASPGSRPQQAIDVAWLLQDVQRRNGMAVTEPVVLDLDGAGRASAVGASPAAGPNLQPPPPDPSQDAAPIPPGPAHRPTVTSTDAAAFPPAFPVDEPDLPPPTIFPFADGPDVPTALPAASHTTVQPSGLTSDDSAAADVSSDPDATWSADAADDSAAATLWPTTWPADQHTDEPGETLWPSTWPADGEPSGADAPAWAATPLTDEPGETLWPSTWPADGEPSGADVPAWAATPFTDHEAGVGGTPAPVPAAAGGDGGSIDDIPPLVSGGDDDVAPPGVFGAIARPPELDELPSWYTDPLPNAGDLHNGGSPGAGSEPARPVADPTSGDSSVGGPRNRDGGASGDDVGTWGADHRDDGTPPIDTGESATGRPGADPWGTAGDAGGHRLPGAGDELRSLFGEIVGGEPTGVNGNGANGNGNGNGAPAMGPAAKGEPVDGDPLGPPEDRPPIDLRMLERPLGPAPYLPPRGESGTPSQGRAASGHDAPDPPRLPRRGEAGLPAPSGDQGAARLPRAGDGQTGAPARTPRPGPRQVAPVGADAPGSARGVSTGPPALPVIILVAVVLVLVLVVAWLVVAGDDGGTRASDRPPAEQSTDAAPTGVQVNDVPEGVQVTWTGADDASYLVTVLSAEAPPQALPATIGTSALVTNVEGAPAARCFTVSLVDAGTPGAPTAPVCTPGASADQMQTG